MVSVAVESNNKTNRKGMFFLGCILGLGGFIQKIPHLLQMGINAVEHLTEIETRTPVMPCYDMLRTVCTDEWMPHCC